MHKSLRIPGPARNPLWRTVRSPLADRPQVPCWHLLFHLLHIGVTDAYRIDRRQSRTVRVTRRTVRQCHVAVKSMCRCPYSGVTEPMRTARRYGADRPPYISAANTVSAEPLTKILHTCGLSASYPRTVRITLSRQLRILVKVLELNLNLGSLLINTSKNCKISMNT